MISLIHYLILSLGCSNSFIVELSQDYQFQAQQLDLQFQDFALNQYFTYGLWSKYIPLGQISQIGRIGIFDSNCYHLHNAGDSKTMKVDLIYFDCLDFELMQITKGIQFYDNVGNFHSYNITLDQWEYESHWYFFQIAQWPIQQRFELHFINYPDRIFSKVLNIQYPYRSINPFLTFGGGLILHLNNDFFQNMQGRKQLSYFPGKLYYEYLYVDKIDKVELKLSLDTFQDLYECHCQANLNMQIQNDILIWLDNKLFTSENANCASFGLSGWLKIQEIHQINDDFDYKFIKMNKFSQNQMLNDDNLSAFQLLYRISYQKFKIVIMTYSYNFPSVNIDFSKNPFLIKKELEIINDIYFWHYLQVSLSGNNLQIKITFYEGENKHIYQESINVYHFNEVQFQIHYGNINQQPENYINVKIENFLYYNCDNQLLDKSCHPSCEKCDGPTNSDCLSCSQDSNRIYIPQHKTCVCHYNSIDLDFCYSKKHLNFQILKQQEKAELQNICQYGYFNLNSQICIKCPSIIQTNLITCLECIQNPINWKNDPYCQTILYIIEDNTFNTFIDEKKSYYILVDDEVQLCQECTRGNFNDYLQIYQDFSSSIQLKKEICQKNYSQHLVGFQNQLCYNCQISLCRVCVIQNDGYKCLACDYGTSLQDGICKPAKVVQKNNFNDCVSPFYRASTKQCKICPIKYCKFCFEFESNDLSKSTLYKDYEEFNQDENHNIGCALCEENFIFDFRKGLCIHQKPMIQYCQRSFINLLGQEICTLSSIDDFSIAPEIINCQKYITNCLQCVLSPQQIIKCVICKDGYKNSVKTGHCYLSSIPYCKTCSEGISNPFDAWVQLIQSFLMQFLPNQYYYYVQDITTRQIEITIECMEGYKLISNLCFKTCESDCLSCQDSLDEFISIECMKCPLNYYRLPNRSKDKGICLTCSQLCQICQVRSKEEIQIVNPEFIINQNNVHFSYKCLQPAIDPHIKINPKLQIAKYCFSKECEDQFYYEYFVNCSNLYQGLTYGTISYYQQNISKAYLNNMGVETIEIIFNFSLLGFETNCFYLGPIRIDNSLKEEVFSLQIVKIKIMGQDKFNTKIYDNLIINNFNVVEISQLQFQVDLPFYINLNSKSVTLIIKETIFEGKTNSIQSQFQIRGQLYSDFILKNVTFQNLLIIESYMFNIKYNNTKGIVFIENLQFINCTFTNSSFIYFSGNPQKIILNNLQFINCQFYNSSSFIFFENDLKMYLIYIQQFSVIASTFKQSILINYPYDSELVIQDLDFLNNSLIFTTIIVCNSKAIYNDLALGFNYFTDSIFLISNQVNQTNDINIDFQNIQIYSNSIKNSSIIKLTSNLIQNSYNIFVSNIKILGNQNEMQNHQKYYLFYIHAQVLKVSQVIIKDCPNQNFFFVFQTQDIIFQDILFANSRLKSKVPLSLSCLDLIEQNQQFLEIQGFQKLKLINFLALNHFNIDQPLIQIFSNMIYQSDLSETINIQNLTFQNNILLKNKIENLLSLIAIYSEQTQMIQISNIKFIQNIYNQYSDDLSSSSSLFYINSQFSEVMLYDCFFYNNMLTNSFNSFAIIQSNNTFIQNFTVKNLNIITEDIFKQYYKIGFLEMFTQEEILLIIKSYLKIRNKGGFLQIIASSFQIQDSTFENILAQSSAVFEITTKSFGVVRIKQITLKNIQVDFTQNLDIYGSISIFSENSQLQLELTDVKFIDVYNKFGSSSLTLFPSMKQNTLVFTNIYLENSLSLMNSFIKLEFQQQEINLNSIIIQNMTVIQSLEAWNKYFTFAGTLSIIEMLKILYDNAIINIFGSSVQIIGLNVQGVLFSSVLKVIDAQQFYMAETYFNSISAFLSINMIYIGQDRLKKIQLYIQQIEFDSYAQFEPIKNQIIITNLIPINNQFSKCSLTIEKSHFIQSNLSLNSIIKQLNINLQQSNTGSMIFIQSQTNQNKLILNSLKIKNNNFSNCELGVIYFEIQNFNQIKINEILCYLNKNLKNGCITFISNSTLIASVIIQNSQFIGNDGTQGSGITSQNINIKISNCIFLKNSASLQGGAIYIGSNSNQVQFFKTIIMENEAKVAGGIYLDGNNSLNQNNFNKSILQFNKAYENSNNLIEMPHHLGLQINDQEMSFSQSVSQGIVTNTLKLNSFQTIQQGKSIKSIYLMIPSNQQIGNYGLFKIQERDYFVQINNISLSFRNSMNELQNNVHDYICELSQTIASQDEIISKEQKFLQILFLDNQSQKFDFGTQMFQFDPYLNYNKQLQIQIDCIVQSSYKQLRYIIYAKSYLCQLGEYYVAKGCQKCQSIQGYYSVTYNATKCSIIDNTKFQNITSNLISLNPGYWRPDYFSDQTEQCFKNQIFCQGGWEVGDKLCLKGHIGGLCEECDIYNIRGFGQYYKSLTNMQCEICPKLSINLILFIFVTFWSFLSIFLSVRSIEKTNLLYSSLGLKQKFRGIIFKLNQDHQSFLIKMLLNYLWLFSLIYSFNINFSFSNTFFESASNSSLVLAYSLDCYLSSQISTNIEYSRIITMIILILFLFILYVLINKLYSIFKKHKFRMSIVTNTILYLYLSNNSTLIKSFCSLLAIRQISNIDFVQGNVSLLFNTQTHFKWIIGFILPGLILVGAAIPVFLFMLLYFRREKLQRIQFRRHICYLFNEYNQSTYFWEQIKIWKKTLVIFIMIYFETNVLLKASLLGLCSLLYQSLALKYKPFILNSLNVLDIQTSQLCSISIFLAAVQYVSDQQNHAISFIIQIILILLWIKLCQPFIFKILSIYYKKYRIVFLSKIQNCLMKIKQNSCLVLILNKQIIKWKTKERIIKQNYGKLKMYLICYSKLSLEQHKNTSSYLIPLQTLRSRISFRENDPKQLF